jgi:DNA-binding SARP family transcriptional activator
MDGPVDTLSPVALDARLLGTMQIALGGRQIELRRGRRATMLAYLLLRRDRPIPRDALAAAFWPDASPAAARNRLHVAMHAMRADLRTVSPVPIVVFERGFSLNPRLDVRLDVEEFERAAARGEHAEQRGEPDTALTAYRDAAREYRGDLLADYPYDDWVLLPRERYRTRMLDVLGRAAQLAFDLGRYPETVDAALRLLALDAYREDQHRLLMRAYARLGRPHMALRQFEICSRELRRELEMAPARETVELYGRIRVRSPV